MAIEVRRVSADGRGALHALLLRGEGAGRLLSRAFSPRVGRPHLATHGDLLGPQGEPIDDGLLLRLEGSPETYLVTLHGNPHVADALIEWWVSLGATASEDLLPPWGDGDPIFRDALSSLPRAPGSRAAAFLLEQGSAGFARWLRSTAGRVPSQEEIGDLLELAPVGEAVLVAARVALAGVPNSGKSTLLNRLVGEERVVTSPLPGTTRDLIEETILCGGFPVTLIDGAGLREEGTDLELRGMERMGAAIASADLVLHLLPPWVEGPSLLEGDLPPLLKIGSRCDEDRSRMCPGQLPVSGITGEGLDELRSEIPRRLYGCSTIPRGIPVPFLARHRRVLESAWQLASGGSDPSPVLAALREDL